MAFSFFIIFFVRALEAVRLTKESAATVFQGQITGLICP